VTADLGLVAHASDRDALELSAQRAGDRPTQAGLADSRRADEAQDGARRIRLQRPHRQVLEDPVLDLLQVVVVGVQHLAGVRHVEVVVGLDVPRQLDQPLQVGADHPVLGGGRWQALEPRQLALGRLPGVLGERRLLDPLPQLVDLGLSFVALPQLVLDRLQLLAQEVLALALLHLRLDLGLDLGAELHHLQLAGEDLGEAAQALGDVDLLQKLLLLLG
jgi:hypothetical protein